MAGRKSLTHDGERLWLHGGNGRELVSLALSDDVVAGMPFAYALPAGAGPQSSRYTLEAALTLLQDTSPATPTAVARPSRSAVVHMRTLLALDGAAAGASQREIAVVLFGEEDVERRWSPDGELRAQVRYLLQRGRACVGGDYRRLLA